MTDSERPSPESYRGGENSGNAVEASSALHYSGAPITREEVYPGKNPENQFSMELLEAWAWKRTWATPGGRGFCFSGAPTSMERLLRVLWRKDF